MRTIIIKQLIGNKFWGRVFLIFTLFLILNPLVFAQADLNGIKICIDPGHGPGNSNQGPTGLKEHYINMRIARHLQEYLKSAGAAVILTRTEEGSDVSLSQREDIANRNNVDFFHSVHHNAYNGQARYTLALYQEIIGQNRPKWLEALRMCNLMAPWIYRGLRTSGWYARGDHTFLGFNLGVLKDLIMPGTLSEATFHDNPGEERKLRNEDFLKVEAHGILLSFLEYFYSDLPNSGTVVGYVRDPVLNQVLNGANMQIYPGVLDYQTDLHGNGFYAFHDLDSGDYTLSATTEGYVVQTIPVNVAAPGFTYADASILPDVPPTVIGSSPKPDMSGAMVYSLVKIKFDRPMSQQETQKAVSIQPWLAGDFLWSSDSKLLTFTHDTYFKYATTYTVAIDTFAVDLYGMHLDGNSDGVGGDAHIFSFTTVTRQESRPLIEMFYPRPDADDVWPTDLIRLRFNKPLDLSTVNLDNFSVYEGRENEVLGAFHSVTTDTSTWVAFVPDQPLMKGVSYVVWSSAQIKDTLGLILFGAKQWTFTVRDEELIREVLDDFEVWTDGWLDPELSEGTYGTVDDSTRFRLSHGSALFDTSSGVLSYKFSHNEGLVELFKNESSVQFNANDVVQIYIKGDDSGNSIRFYLLNGDGEPMDSPWETIDWLGWKLLTFDLAGTDVLSGNTGLLGFQLKYSGDQNSKLYFDNFMVLHRTGTNIEIPVSTTVTPQFKLFRNYPNPFNPITTISYELPEPEWLKIRIIDINGREVATLVDSEQNSGLHKLVWDASGQSSGLYFCELVAGKRRAYRKMILSR